MEKRVCRVFVRVAEGRVGRVLAGLFVDHQQRDIRYLEKKIAQLFQ
jgi:hypothetical protein